MVGYKQTDIGLIPVDWEVKTLSQICLFENGDRGVNYPSKSDFIAWGKLFVNTGHLKKKRVSLENMDYISTKTRQNLSTTRFSTELNLLEKPSST